MNDVAAMCERFARLHIAYYRSRAWCKQLRAMSRADALYWLKARRAAQ